MFDQLKGNADRLAAEAAWLRRERNAHAKQGYVILKRRIGSPPGLIVCFGAGVFAGARSRHEELYGEKEGRRRDRPSEHAETGFAERLLHGPLGAAAIRFGTAYLVGALMHPEQPAGSGHPDTLL